MLRILQKIFPENSIEFINNRLPIYGSLLTVNIDEKIFFLEIIPNPNKEIVIEQILNFSLQDALSNKKISIKKIDNILIDTLNKEKLQILYDETVVVIPVNFLVYLSNILHYTYYLNTSYIKELQIELYRFQTSFISLGAWHEIPNEILQEIFYYLIINQIVTPKMLALFFKKIPFNDISAFFSKKIAKEIIFEYLQLEEVENPELLNSIYYIIEHNLINYLQRINNPPSIFQSYKKLLQYYQQCFLEDALPDIILQNNNYFNKLLSSNKIHLILSELSDQGLMSFLKHSSYSNVVVISEFLSKNKKIQVENDLKNNWLIEDSMYFIDLLAKISSLYSLDSIEIYTDRFLRDPRDWELLSRELDIRDLILCLESLPRYCLKNLSKILQNIYLSYQREQIIFPTIKKRSLKNAQNNFITAIYKLFYLKLLTNH